MATMEGLNPELRTFLKMYKWHRIDAVVQGPERELPE